MQYKIEDIDFASLLQEELKKENLSNKLCLISKLPLNDTKIKLMCGHEFNYVAIYREVVKQKTIYNSLASLHLRSYQIQCPYCRHVQNKVLPYMAYPNIQKINGVNAPKKHEMMLDKCSYKFKSGKRKGKACNKYCNGTYCSSHLAYMKKHSEKEKKQNVIISDTTDKSSVVESIMKQFPINEDFPTILNSRTVVELKKMAKDLSIKGYYKYKKTDLVKKIGEECTKNI